ncbi:Uncharacterized mitochondrial protein AtMg01410 [Striga hermonthica]|uniref:Uncharacterized mitochondrial protein AtMg01410 n=1 Tax=Striga hermonthica TaxID=68872 RepID=A0A9N7MPA1_STRHE|nr:Uncharacterized mitochondrial protein AtMg01410 [Striga hermonthica]
MLKVSSGKALYGHQGSVMLGIEITRFIPGLDLDWFEARIGPALPSSDDLSVRGVSGHLGCSIEGAGKRRFLAISNYRNQRLLRPVHDWLPLVYLFELVAVLFDRSFASSVVNSTLAYNTFLGQPLGYYGSWPLFAFSHHLVVWLAKSKVYPGWRFSDYGVLGDDVVISDPHVAPIYADYIRRLGV